MIFARYSLCFSVLFIVGCNWYSNCPVLDLAKEDLSWLDRYTVGDTIIMESNKKSRDTLIVTDRTTSYSPCNKFELGPYQLQRIEVHCLVKGKGKNTEDIIVFMRSEKIDTSSYAINIELYGLGCYAFFRNNELEDFFRGRKVLREEIYISTFRRKINTFRVDNKNVSSDGYKLLSFHWSEKYGLIRYETSTGEIFELVPRYRTFR